MLSRWLGGLTAAAAALVACVLVILDLTDAGLRRWWDAHALTTDTIAGYVGARKLAGLLRLTGLGLARGHIWSPEFVLGLALGLGLLMVVIILLLHMTTEVTPTDLRVWFGWIPTYRRSVLVTTIVRLEVVSYRPVADYWGWGIRSGRDGERVLIARGNRGVRIDLADADLAELRGRRVGRPEVALGSTRWTQAEGMGPDEQPHPGSRGRRAHPVVDAARPGG